MEPQRAITYGQIREISKSSVESRIIPFTLSTSSRDRHHSVINQRNWDLKNFKKNPVVGYMHNLYGDLLKGPDPDDVIATDKGVKVEDLSSGLTLVGYPQFETADINLKAEKIFRKILFGSLRGASVGFLDNGKGKWGTGNEAQGRENETFYFDRTELLEYSIVPIPSNSDGVKRSTGLMRAQVRTAIVYAFSQLGKNFSLSQIEEMRVCDVMDLLDGKDLGIKEKNPEKVKKMIFDKAAQLDRDMLIEKQMKEFREKYLKN